MAASTPEPEPRGNFDRIRETGRVRVEFTPTGGDERRAIKGVVTKLKPAAEASGRRLSGFIVDADSGGRFRVMRGGDVYELDQDPGSVYVGYFARVTRLDASQKKAKEAGDS